MLPGQGRRGLTTTMRTPLTNSFSGDKEGSKSLMVLRVKPIPTRLPTDILNTPLDSKLFHNHMCGFVFLQVASIICCSPNILFPSFLQNEGSEKDQPLGCLIGCFHRSDLYCCKTLMIIFIALFIISFILGVTALSYGMRDVTIINVYVF